MSIETGKFWTFGKGKRLSSKPNRRAVQIYNHNAAVEYAKAKRLDQLGTSGAAGPCRKIEVTDEERARLLAMSKRDQ